ncbi:uncharacterized protein LOC143174332 [Nomia melanderi]|uniref:uncharacterized protein LOC143174332 n=1 Tax=Nomia melanderi TaxID=2448451 RepID=UPI003FCE7A3C
MGKSVDIFKSQYFNLCRVELLLTGLWPYQTKMAVIPLRIFLSIFVVAFFNAEICKIITSRHDMRILIETTPPFLSCIGIMIKYTNGWINIKKMKELIGRIKYDWECAVLNKEDHIFEFYAKEVWKVNMEYAILLHSMTLFYLALIITPGVLNKLTSWNITRFMHQPIHVEFFVDEDEYFLYILMFINISITIALTILLAVDLELNIIIGHACTMFAVVGYRLENVFRFNSGQPEKIEKIERILVSTIQYHKETIKFVEGINSYCSNSYILLCGVAILLFSTLLLHVFIVIRSSEGFDVVAIPVLNFVGHVTVLYFNTIMAQRMMDVSSDVFHQSYCGEWYSAPITAQKMLLIIMGKCLKPATIVFANFVTLSREKFAMILETSMSYFMVLYSLQ